MRTRVTTSLLGLGLTAAALVGCQTRTWTSTCSTDTTLRSSEISVSGNAFQDLPFPVSGPILAGVGENSLDFTISRTR
ncbi:hypothetical protein [Micrococcus sp. Alg238-R198]|uniref:hypothetical protein n=1 Tax=Micrococcus sp. Alg238-R198 TaxID=2305988 RepID=UPI0013D0753C|nr:hypothetical protein [Micrococcus sp. Alg238-R198]